MEAKGTYADFVNKVLDEIDFLGAPKSSEQLEKLLAECGLVGQSIEEVRKHIASSVAKYERMIAKEIRKPWNSRLTWNDFVREVDKRRSGRLAREEAGPVFENQKAPSRRSSTES